MSDSLQDRYAPENRCFGCGPKNPQGLRIKSRVEGDELVADWTPEEHHQAFGGVLNGGIAGALLDCHSNWCAAWTLMVARGLDAPPCTVTADFHVKLRAPTSLAALRVYAKAASVEGDRVIVDARIESQGSVTASCRGTFVAVKPGHPAYHRW
jgi:acyl-coenzyme A thioesterase PaaI-like protein